MKLTIHGIEINVVVTDDTQYKTWTMDLDGEFGWGVTDLSSQRTVGGRKPTKDEALAMIDDALKSLQELHHAAN